VNARAVAAWSATCILIVLSTSNPIYKALVLVAALLAVGSAAGLRKMRPLVLGSHDVIDSLPTVLSRTGAAIAASVNLVPVVAATFVQVSEAQRLRGWRPRGPRSWAEIVVPVVLTSVEASMQLAESMEARAYGTGPRTVAGSLHMRRGDWMVVGASSLAVAAFIAARVAGWAPDWYPYPTLSFPTVDPRPLLSCLLLFVPVTMWRSRG